VLRLCGSAVSKQTAVRKCTGLKQLFVKGQVGVIFRNTQTVLQLSATKHTEALDGHVPAQKQRGQEQIPTEMNKQKSNNFLEYFSSFQRTMLQEFPVQNFSSVFLITLTGPCCHEFVHSHVGPTQPSSTHCTVTGSAISPQVFSGQTPSGPDDNLLLFILLIFFYNFFYQHLI